jgi:hypothetical protein
MTDSLQEKLTNFLLSQIWSTYEEEVEQEAQVDDAGAALAPEYLDVVVSSVRDTSPFSFSVQILKQDSECLPTRA